MKEVQCNEVATLTGWAFSGVVPYRGYSICLCFWQAGHLAVAKTGLAL